MLPVPSPGPALQVCVVRAPRNPSDEAGATEIYMRAQLRGWRYHQRPRQIDRRDARFDPLSEESIL